MLDSFIQLAQRSGLLQLIFLSLCLEGERMRKVHIFDDENRTRTQTFLYTKRSSVKKVINTVMKLYNLHF